MPRTVSVAITANTSGFTAGMTRVAGSAKSTAQSVKASFASNLSGIAKKSEDFDRIGNSLLKIGAVSAIGLGLSAKAAIDWESAWTGVTKTVDGSAEQMGVLEGQLRGLARTLPESHDQIAAVAEAAGQLGIQRDSVAEFTKTMVQLGDTTNLSADDAATSLAQFGNIMGTLTGPANQVNDNISRLGATIVGLGNAGASTEADIVGMGLRIAGAGKAVGLSQQQVLGFASAVASTGVEVEAGGTAMSSVFLKIDQAVRKGGSGLDLLAKTAGVSSSAFKKGFQTDAAGATTKFIEGLGKIQAAGGDTTKVLKDLGVTGIRESDVIRRLANSGSLLADNLNNANVQFDRNSALVDEAAKRYATTGSQAKIALNQVKDSAITVGQALLPAFSQVATVIGSLATAFGQMSAPARNAAVAVGLTVAAVGLLGGGSIKAITGLAQLRGAFKAAGLAASASSKLFKIAGLSIPIVGLALFAVTTAMQAFASRTTNAQETAATFAQAMQTVEGNVDRATAAINANVRESAIQTLQSSQAFDNAKQLGLSLSTVTDASLGNKDAIAQVNSVLSANLALNPQLSAANADRYNAAVALSKQLGSVATAEIGAVQAEQDRRAAMEGGAGASDAAADSAKKHADAVAEDAAQMQAAVDAVYAYSNALLQLSGSQIGMEAAMDAARKAAKDNGDTLDINTAKGRANQQALNSLASATTNYTKSLVESGAGAGEIVAANERGRNSFIRTAIAMGKTRGEARALANALFTIPKDIKAQVVVAGSKVSKKEAEELNAALKKIPKDQRARIVTIAETKGADAAFRAIERIKDKTVIARSKGDLKGAKQVDAAMKALKDRLVEAKARGDKRGADLIRNAMNALKDKTVKARATGDASGAFSVKRALDALQNKTIYVNVKRRQLDDIKAATGGYVAGGVLHRAEGGPVWGAGSATSDSIPAWLSNGEYVIRAAAVRAVGISKLHEINSKGYASGGSVSLAAGGPVGADALAILKYMAAVLKPLADVNKARRKVSEAQDDKRDADSKKERRKADRELTAATKELKEAQKAAAESMRQTADALADPYRSKSHDIDDWLESMRTGKEDLAKFQDQVGKLRKLGVSEAIIKQITDQGAIVGSELAQQIIDGGSELAKSLNKANTDLQKASQNLAYTATVKPKGHAAGGPVSGPGSGTSDSITARLSNGEWVVPAHAVRANRSMLEAITYGRATPQPRFMPGFAFGGPVSSTVTREYRGGDVIIRDNVIADPDLVLRRARAAQRDSQTMFGLTVGV